MHLEYFIWEQDALTGRFCQLLAEKVRQGVEVRVLYDWVGSIGYGKRQLKALRRAGAGVSADAAKWTKLNYRNHRKIAVIDGRVAYTGGMNMGQEYIDGKPRYESWRDTHVRFGGPLVADLQRLFAIRWLRATRKSVFSERYFPRLDHEVATNTVWAQVVNSGPESSWAAVRNAFLIAIASAEKQVQIQSPYFIPDQGIEDALVAQSLAGVETRLMMTGVPDKRIPWWAAFTYIDDFVRAGGHVFQYRAGFFHPKTMTIDGSVAVIGTTNFDRAPARALPWSSAVSSIRLYTPIPSYSSAPAISFNPGTSHEPSADSVSSAVVGSRWMPARQFSIALCSASAARLLQCILIGGRPSSASATSLRVTSSASSRVMPFTSSVVMLEVATAEAAPERLELDVLYPVVLDLQYNISMMSPQTGLPTRPTATSSPSSIPTLRGLRMHRTRFFSE